MPPIAEMIADPRLVAIPAAAVARKGVQWMWIGFGGFLVLAGIVIAPLPGPFGLPISVLGLVVVLRNSSSAKRGFIRLQRRHPKWLFPVRRMMRGKRLRGDVAADPEGRALHRAPPRLARAAPHSASRSARALVAFMTGLPAPS